MTLQLQLHRMELLRMIGRSLLYHFVRKILRNKSQFLMKPILKKVMIQASFTLTFSLHHSKEN